MPPSSRLSARILSCVFWTRTTVLVLAIAIVAASLSVYSLHTVPIFSLFSGGGTNHHHQTAVLLEMVQDRRLISTLVAAQASVFCPLFLLLNHSRKKEQDEPSSLALDLICCHVLMPLGLALSWTFCIMFDRKTMMALMQGGFIGEQLVTSWTDYMGWHDMCLLDRNIHGEWPCLAVNGIHGFKYLIVLVLAAEIYMVIAAAVVLRREHRQELATQGVIQLCIDEKSQRGYCNTPISFMGDQQHDAFTQV
ncbi:hypothetical protein K492DRAFT_200415 [Lichtheimia hyalospora FSU 10163]|nr:hypothetical protein K492DRAFT_200415 [Lichtheimia hyalospora FSU 10163]